jgi:hypothetical protein
MKFCYQCGKLTSGEPLFCGSCGRTYDVRLCPRLHANPRHAKYCFQCGSDEFSKPQPKVSIWWKVLEFLARAFFGVLLAYFSLAFLVWFLGRPETQGGLVMIGILLGILWWLWSQLPEWFRKLVRRVLKRKERKSEHR